MISCITLNKDDFFGSFTIERSEILKGSNTGFDFAWKIPKFRFSEVKFSFRFPWLENN